VLSKEMTINTKILDPSPEIAVELKGIVKDFADFRAVDGIDLEIRKGEFFALLGPSGCGKTTLLRMISGLEVPTQGQIKIAGIDVVNIPACNRPVNTVFQSYALFPHMTVKENISFGLRMKNLAKDEIHSKVDKIMQTVQINQFADRKPSQLSGGQKQRVALARALVNEPEVLLLDEPLGALDLKLRKELQVELISLQRKLKTTFICVTHDQEEALSMADRIAVMNKGKIEQLGDAEELYEFPRTKYVGNFLGTCDLVNGTVTEVQENQFFVGSELGSLRVEPKRKRRAVNKGEKVTLGIRPEKVSLKSTAEGFTENCFEVKISELIYIGSETHYLLKADKISLSAEIMNSKVGSQGFELGQKAFIYLPPAGLILLED
jgi:spermidine/putrescine transport system ATP-binding protein